MECPDNILQPSCTANYQTDACADDEVVYTCIYNTMVDGETMVDRGGYWYSMCTALSTIL